MVKWLSEQRVDNREENKAGTSPLGVATQFGHLEVAEWLKEQGEKDLPYSRGLLYCNDSYNLLSNNSWRSDKSNGNSVILDLANLSLCLR